MPRMLAVARSRPCERRAFTVLPLKRSEPDLADLGNVTLTTRLLVHELSTTMLVVVLVTVVTGTATGAGVAGVAGGRTSGGLTMMTTRGVGLLVPGVSGSAGLGPVPA